MERNGSRAVASAVWLRALVPLTSREEDERYWYDPGDRGASLAKGTDRVYWFDSERDRVDVGWSHAGPRSGH
jgi:hypothetical protein